MGRVDDALRRAGAGQPDQQPGSRADAVALSREPFPSEGPPTSEELFPVAESTSETMVTAADQMVLQEAATTGATPPAAELHLHVPPPDAEPSAGEAVPAEKSVFQKLDTKLAGKIVVDQAMNPVFREQYRRLAASLHQAQAEHGLKVVMVVSAAIAEGKTLTAANLALTLSESYHRRVLLIDGDLRRPSLHTLFNVPPGKGLSEGLYATADTRMPLHPLTTRLALLTAGRPTSDPLAGLTSERMRRVLTEGRNSFDWVIVDTPPVGLLPDGHLLTSMGDGALLVIKAGETAYKLVQRAIEAIGRDRVLGVVLNKASVQSAGGYYYRYHDRAYMSSAATP